jgi:hypothetical protein
MVTVLCSWGPAVEPGRTGVARTTDARGLVLRWLGVNSD